MFFVNRRECPMLCIAGIAALTRDRGLAWAVLTRDRGLAWAVLTRDRGLAWAVLTRDRGLAWAVREGEKSHWQEGPRRTCSLHTV